MNKKLLTFPLLLVFLFLAACQGGLSTSRPVSAAPTMALSQVNTSEPAQSAAEGNFTLNSPDLPSDGRLPVEYTCDGDSSTLALNWSGAPAGTKSYALIMYHHAPETIHWYWVLYDIPAEVTSLPKNVSGVGMLGNNINNGKTEYSPPCSKGPGDKEYIYAVYALSAEPQITVAPEKVDRDTLLAAIKDLTLATAEIHVIYARP